MTRTISFLASAATVLVLSMPSFAAGLSDQFATCVTKFADHKLAASVMLECNAADGKLNACKVLEAPSPANGFDKAALCVAEVLPVGTKTGTIKVPLKFNPS